MKRIIQVLKLDINIHDKEDEDFQKNYEILLGEFNAGNNSPQIKNGLKKYILEGIQENKIPKHQAMMLLYQLSL